MTRETPAGTNAAQTGSADARIVAKDLHKTFKSKRGAHIEAVRGVSLTVGSGEIFGFLGPNGAGKTTTLRMLTTLLPIDRGTATVAGFDVRHSPEEVRRRIGYVSQLGGADELATGRENLILQARLYGSGAAEAATRAEELTDLLDLGSFVTRKVITYSGGQRRRLDVALGIVHRPAVLFLDEPSTGLDPQNRVNLWDHIRGLRGHGTAVVLTTHYLEEADELCDRVMIVDHGQVVAEGAPRELKRAVGGDSVLLTLQDGLGQRAQTELSTQPFVREMSTEGAQLRLYVEDGGTAIPMILRLLDQQHIGLRSMSLSEPTLDDVFLRHTGRSLRDAGQAEKARAEAAP